MLKKFSVLCIFSIIILGVILSTVIFTAAKARADVKFFTKDGYLMALSEGSLVQAMRLHKESKFDELQKMLDNSEVGFSKPGIEMSVVSNFPFKGICRVVPVGLSDYLWMEIAGLTDKKPAQN